MSRVKGPKDGKKLKALFNSREKILFPDLKQTNVLILISINGNEYCSDEYLNAIIEEACSSHQKVTLLIADEVYWNNLKDMDLISHQDVGLLKARAIELGDEFITRNIGCFLAPLQINPSSFQSQYSELSINEQISVINTISTEKGLNCNVIRWNDWINDPQHGFLNVKEDIQRYYESDPQLISSIEETATDFADRHKHEGSRELWLMRSKSYLKDESPAVIWIAAKLNYQFIAYPGEMISAFKATKNFFIHEKPSGILPNTVEIISSNSHVNWLDIYFKRSSFINQLSHVATMQDLAISRLSFFPNAPPSQKYEVEKTGEFVVELTHTVFSNPELNVSAKINILISLLHQLEESLDGIKGHALPTGLTTIENK